MRVHIIPQGTEHLGVRPADRYLPSEGNSDVCGPWRPRAVIGATSGGGLLLPQAQPTAGWLYAPRGVHIDDDRVVVADTGNHRVMVFDGVPDRDGAQAAVVLGQVDATSEGPQSNGHGPEAGMHLPTGVAVLPDGRLVVADAWNHRILIWDDVPDTNREPDLVLGQRSSSEVEPNRGIGPTNDSFYWPFGFALVDGRFYVADTGNRRVLCWTDGVPDRSDRGADVVLGQPDATSREENRGFGVGPSSFRWPHAISSTGSGGVLVADAGNHRVLGWSTHPEGDTAADLVLGQPTLQDGTEFPYAPQTGTRFRFPYAMANVGAELAVGDTANNRVLIWNSVPSSPDEQPDYVLGQLSFSSNGENRWASVESDTLCWPYGLASHGPLLAIADSGNNRVVLWERS